MAGWWPGWLPRRPGWLAGGGLEAWLGGLTGIGQGACVAYWDAPTISHKSASDTNCSPKNRRKKGKKRGEKRKKEKIAGKRKKESESEQK